jgi:hypothetical protein
VLHLGQVKEWAEAGTLAGAEGSVVVEEVEAEVDEAADGRLAVDEDVRLGEVPAAGADEELGGSVVELVLPPARRVAEADGASHGIPQVDLPVHQVLPRRRQRVLEVSLPRFQVVSGSQQLRTTHHTCFIHVHPAKGQVCTSALTMKTLAPELSALMTIFRGSAGPVISTVRSATAGGTGAHVQSPSRTSLVAGSNRGSSPASYRRWASRRCSMA